MLEIEATRPLDDIAARLMAGDIVILRGAPEIRAFRDEFLKSDQALVDFYDRATVPSTETLARLSAAIRRIRHERRLSCYLAPLIARMGFPSPVRLDGGISRLVLPASIISAARASGLFPEVAFQRQSADGEVEVFMPKPANIHRDFNRPHFLFQANLWFPLHDADADRVLRIFPAHYRSEVFDLEPTSESFASLGPPLNYRLSFGDAILFHGEHLHTSPQSSGDDRRRHSYDFRIAASCTDDNAHYRSHFLDARNFAGAAIVALQRIEGAETPDADLCARTLADFDAVEFAEDRYLILAEHAAFVAPSIAKECCLRVCETSPHWFWHMKAAERLRRLGQNDLAAKAFSSARRLAQNDTNRRNFAPVSYTNVSTQMSPDDAILYCDGALSAS